MRRSITIVNLQQLTEPHTVAWIPYIHGVLQSYVEQFDDIKTAYAFERPLWRLQSLDRMLDRFENPDVVGFSTYVWNHENSHRLARAVKERYPHALIVFGGPHVPNNASDFLEKHPWVDLAVHGEGEQAFAAVLRERMRDVPEWENVPGISYRLDGTQKFTRPTERLKSLDIPSPFTSGCFDSFLTEAGTLNLTLMAGLETTRGCPYSCSFCDWGSATMSKIRAYPEERVRAEFEWLAAHKVGYVSLNDANFGILPRDLSIMQFIVDLKARTGYPMGLLPLGFAKNNKDRAFTLNKMIKDAGLDDGHNVNFSLQATSEDTLAAIGRSNIKLDNYRALGDDYARSGYQLVPDLILPLPGETFVSFTDGYADLATWRHVQRIRIYPCTVLPNAPMARPAYREQWGLRTEMVSVKAQNGLVFECEDAATEWIETVVETATMSAHEVAEARTFVALVNAMEVGGATRVLRTYVTRNSAITAGAFYRALMEWQRQHDGVLRFALDAVHRGSVSYADEIAWSAECETSDGQRLKHHKALLYEALTRAEQFAAELRQFLEDAFGLALDPLLDELLRFQTEAWILPSYRGEEAAHAYAHDWTSWLDSDRLRPAAVVAYLVYRPRAAWEHYAALGEDAWMLYALARDILDTCILHEPAEAAALEAAA
jgi:putative methyltransferase